MQLREFIAHMEELAPPELAEEFDSGKIGLVVEGTQKVAKVACALDATHTVVKRAVAKGIDTLIVHHTPIWTPVTSLTGQNASLMRAVLSADMNVYVMHTNFDHAEEGVNDALIELLELRDVTPMSLGCVGSCHISLKEIAKRLGGNIRVWGRVSTINRLAVVGGSGFDPDLLEEARNLHADAFLSAELKHSVARMAKIPCIEATHYTLEAPAMQRLAKRNGWLYIDDPPELQTIS